MTISTHVVRTELLHVDGAIGTDKHVYADVNADLKTNLLRDVLHLLKDGRVDDRDGVAAANAFDP